jgi:hypothetical protein
MGVNYGLNKVRFPAPVPVGSRLRAHLTLLQVDDIKDGAQMTWEVSIERKAATNLSALQNQLRVVTNGREILNVRMANRCSRFAIRPSFKPKHHFAHEQ